MINFRDINGISLGSARPLTSTFTITFSKDVYHVNLFSNGYNATTSQNKPINFTNIQIEEGTTATLYEPYKETNATVYLNSPLLKGDRIEVVDGKLCHYHRCCLKVLNGSESWFKSPSATTENMLSMGLGNISDIQNIICCDKYIKGSSSVLNSIRPDNTLPGIRINISSDKHLMIRHVNSFPNKLSLRINNLIKYKRSTKFVL